MDWILFDGATASVRVEPQGVVITRRDIARPLSPVEAGASSPGSDAPV